MAEVYISIGSNVDAQNNIKADLSTLKNQFGDLTLSPIYQNTAIGFDGDDFINLVVGLTTELSIIELVDSLHQIEAAQGRNRESAKFSPRTLDMDLLLYDQECFDSPQVSIPRDEITKYAFVLQPLFDLIPDFIHPSLNVSIKSLWEDFDKQNLQMTEISLTPIS